MFYGFFHCYLYVVEPQASRARSVHWPHKASSLRIVVVRAFHALNAVKGYLKEKKYRCFNMYIKIFSTTL